MIHSKLQEPTFKDAGIISCLQIPPNDDEHYNFLYIAHGNHVVGVSAPFKVSDEEVIEDLYIERLFGASDLESPSQSTVPSFQQLTCSGWFLTYTF